MEERVTRLVDNTFKNHSFEDAKKIVVDRILWYEMKLAQKEEEQCKN